MTGVFIKSAFFHSRAKKMLAGKKSVWYNMFITSTLARCVYFTGKADDYICSLEDFDMKRKRVIKLCVYHLTALLVLLFLMFVYKCPLNHFFGIPCPGCGVSRAYMAVFRLDFVRAFEYHPLFLTVAPVILYVAHRNVFKKRLSDKVEIAVLCGLSLLFVALYVYRLLNNSLVA